MNKLFYLSFSLTMLASCAGETTETPEEVTDTVKSENFEAIPIQSEYTYTITNLQTGEKIQLNQRDYLNSDYIDNPDYKVEEKVNVK